MIGQRKVRCLLIELQTHGDIEIHVDTIKEIGGQRRSYIGNRQRGRGGT